MPSSSRRAAMLFGVAIAACAAVARAQAPPPEMNLHVLMDVGPVAVPAPCPCITNSFAMPALRPGWGFCDGPAAPEGNAQPSRAARQPRGDPEAQVALRDLYLQARGAVHDPLHAYLWARLAELRLSPGDLRTQAAASAARAARLLSAGDIEDTEKMVEALIADGKKPLR